ncbi:MAG TPA: hypothetical protein VLX29_02560 [Nitrospirota bacterium]|nr:hypothetical protein [Nitrospirota bacterium]
MGKASMLSQYSVVALLVCSAMLLAGCSVKVTPNNVPLITNVETPRMSGVSLLVVNVEKDSSDSRILNDKGHSLGFVANKQAWSKKLVEALASELAKRGAHIRANNTLTLSIALPEIVFNQIQDKYQFKVKAVVTSSTGWSKNYDGMAESGLGLFESADTLAKRVAGRALADAVKAMLSDTEFLAQVTDKK